MMLSNIYMLFLFEWIEMWLPFTHSICTSTWSIFFNFVLICYMVCSQYMVNRKFDLTFSADCHEKDVRERRKVKKKSRYVYEFEVLPVVKHRIPRILPATVHRFLSHTRTYFREYTSYTE